MNLIEAVKSGKAFKRPNWNHLIYYCADTGIFRWDHGAPASQDLRPEWFTFEDWEVEETVVPITEAYFDVAWQRAVKSYPPSGPWLDAFMPTLKKELGL